MAWSKRRNFGDGSGPFTAQNDGKVDGTAQAMEFHHPGSVFPIRSKLIDPLKVDFPSLNIFQNLAVFRLTSSLADGGVQDAELRYFELCAFEQCKCNTSQLACTELDAGTPPAWFEHHHVLKRKTSERNSVLLEGGGSFCELGCPLKNHQICLNNCERICKYI